MLILLVGTFLGFIFETIGLAGRMRRFSEKNTQSVIALLLIALIGSIAIYDFDAQILSKAFQPLFSGFMIGYLGSLWIRRQQLTFTHALLLLAILIFGIAPNAGKDLRRFMEDAGIEEFSTPYLSLKFPREDPAVYLPDRSNGSVPLEPLSKSRMKLFSDIGNSMETYIQRDRSYIARITGNFTKDNSTDKILEVLKNTIMVVNTCIDALKVSYWNEDIELGRTVQPLAHGFSELLKRGTATEETASALKRRFLTAVSEIREIPLAALTPAMGYESGSASSTCLRNGLNGFPSTENLDVFSNTSTRSPYAVMALAALQQLAGDRESAEAAIRHWIERYEKKVAFPVAEKRVYLVRAYAFLDFMARVGESASKIEISLRYIDSLEDLLDETRMRGLLDDRSECGGLEPGDELRRLVFIIKSTKNNFAYAVSNGGRELYSLHGPLALRYATEAREFDVLKCASITNLDHARYIEAAFLDTFAETVRWDAMHDRRKRREFQEYAREADRAWVEARRLLRRMTDGRLRGKAVELRERIDERLLWTRRPRTGD